MSRKLKKWEAKGVRERRLGGEEKLRMYRDKVCELEKREFVGEYDKDSERDKTKRKIMSESEKEREIIK